MNKWTVLKRRSISEKSFIMQEDGKYVFIVDKDANKPEVKKAVETIFGVSVDKINVLNTKGKIKLFKGVKGRRPSFKKAIVKLKEGESLKEL